MTTIIEEVEKRILTFLGNNKEGGNIWPSTSPFSKKINYSCLLSIPPKTFGHSRILT